MEKENKKLKEKIEIQKVLNSVVEGANLELAEYLQFNRN